MAVSEVHGYICRCSNQYSGDQCEQCMLPHPCIKCVVHVRQPQCGNCYPSLVNTSKSTAICIQYSYVLSDCSSLMFVQFKILYHFSLSTDVVVRINPEISSPPVNTVASLYSTATLSCLATGNPRPVIHWFRNGERVSATSADSPTLLVEEMGLDDRGFYHCEASNPSGSSVSKAVILSATSQ